MKIVRKVTLEGDEKALRQTMLKSLPIGKSRCGNIIATIEEIESEIGSYDCDNTDMLITEENKDDA